jgi:hypothetical protein
MFCVNLEDKQMHLQTNLYGLKQLDTSNSLGDLFRDLEVQIRKINSLNDFMTIEERINELNKLLGYEESIDWSDDESYNNNESDEKKNQMQYTVTIIKTVRFYEEPKEISRNPIYRPKFFNFLSDIDKPKKSVIKPKLTTETQMNFIYLLKSITNNIIDLVNREDWKLEIIKYEEMSKDELYDRFFYNSIYELDSILEKNRELCDIKLNENKYVESVCEILKEYNNGCVYTWVINIDKKLDDLLGTILLKYKVLDMIKDLHLNNQWITNEETKKTIYYEYLNKLHKFICLSKDDYYYINLLYKLLEFD